MHKVLLKLCSLLLCTALCGCGAVATSAPVTSAPAYPEDEMLRLVNPASDSALALYAQESPAIDAAVALPGEVSVETVSQAIAAPKDEVRAVWISYLEMQTLLKSKTKAQFTSNIGKVFDDVKGFGLNTVVVQVRPFADALYDSDYFPWSHTITGTEGKDPGFDPLQVMLAEAKSRGLRFDAWINPYRVRAKNNTVALSADNQAQKWLDAGDGAVIRYDGMISYNPASEKARGLIVNGIREIVRNYDVDAIHIDDYFYPATDAAFDSASYTAYKNNGGGLALADWRRSNVETLIKAIYAAVKEENEHVLFGISPQGNLTINYNSQYLDVQKIASNPGYCDYLCPQIYYGFKNQNQPFQTVAAQWSALVKNSDVELYIGLACYKIGCADNYAGTGKNEWLSATNQMQKMVETSRALSGYGGFVLYRYDSLFRPESTVEAKVVTERANLQKILDSN